MSVPYSSLPDINYWKAVQPMKSPLFAAAVCYAVPRVMARVLTPPVPREGRARGPLERTRVRWAGAANHFISEVGEQRWDRFMSVVVDNAWVSAYVLAYLLNNTDEPMTGERFFMACTVVLGTSSLAWMTRLAVSKLFQPPTADRIARWIAPRGFPPRADYRPGNFSPPAGLQD